MYIILLLSACAKPQKVKPLNNLPIDSTKKIELQNLTITSKDMELGRSKIITEEQDIKEILNYISKVSCTKTDKKFNVSNSDFDIDLINNTETKKSYLYSIEISKKQISIIKYNDHDTTESSNYNYQDKKIIEELKRLYSKMKYNEQLLVSK
jgi:hypothetical protein